MFSFFKRRKTRVDIPPDGPPNDGSFHMVWERKRMPSPGAQRYAFESLGLSPFTPIGPSVATRIPIVPLPGGPQPYVGLAVTLNGIPTTAGQILGQPLYNPDTGYGGNPAQQNNNPFPFSAEPYAGQVI